MRPSLFALSSLLLLALPAWSDAPPKLQPQGQLLLNKEAPWSNRSLRPKALKVLKEAGLNAQDWRCNSGVLYGKDLWAQSKAASRRIAAAWGVELDKAKLRGAARIVLGHLVRTNFQAYQGDNLGVVQVKGYSQNGAPLLLYRSGVFVDAGELNSCLSDLINKGGLKHVVNLYTGDFPLHDFIQAEETQILKSGGSHYNAMKHVDPQKPSWRELVGDEAHYEENRAEAQRQVAQLIKETLLQPGGEAPKGNLLVHCGGGMHRSGMLVGIIQKCINAEPMEEIEADYKYHTQYLSKARPNGYEEINVRFIKEFDCGLLK